MRAFEFLVEASGLRAAKPGETYVDDQNTEYRFQSWNWQFPADAEGYPDLTSMEAGVLDAIGGDKNKISWVNKPLARSKSFAFAVFAADNNDEKIIGKFYDQKTPNNTIYDKDVKALLGLSAGSADGKTSAAVKVDAAMQPLDLGVADGRARTFKGIVKAVSNHKNATILVDSLKAASEGQPVVWQGGSTIVTALQDDFCEVLGPIAMMNNHPQVVGDLAQAVADVFKGSEIKDAALSFPVDQNNPLIDSYIIKNGITLGVSSKGKKGAKATITNIWKAKEEATRNPTGRAYVDKFTEAVAVLDICKVESGLTQPIVLALRYKLINGEEANALYEVVKSPRDPKYRLIGDPKNPNAVVKNPLPEDLAKVPKVLMRLFKLGGYKSGSYSSFLCLAQTAHLVSKHVNTDSEIEFGEAIRSFLNSSAMVQAKSVVSTKGTDAILRSVNVVYPPNFQDKAKIESNGYSGTGAKGKFSFSLPTT